MILLKDLSKVQLIQLNQFYILLLKAAHSYRTLISYRGENLIRLHQRLGLIYDEFQPEYKNLLLRLFMVGEKSRNYYSNDLLELHRQRTYSISESEKDIFSFIFDSFNNSLESKSKGVVKFYSSNLELSNFFKNKKTNKKLFLEKCSQLNLIQKKAYRNYYLQALHQLGSIDYSKKSHFVSSSESYSVAKNFSGQSIDVKKVIIHCWRVRDNHFVKIDSAHLPNYKYKPFSNQKEVSFLGGILPHYIIGLEVTEDKKFFINPNLFNSKISEQIIMNGFDIDQSKFDEVLRKTRYRGSFISDSNEIIDR